MPPETPSLFENTNQLCITNRSSKDNLKFCLQRLRLIGGSLSTCVAKTRKPGFTQAFCPDYSVLKIDSLR